jgi:hypothetical protein
MMSLYCTTKSYQRTPPDKRKNRGISRWVRRDIPQGTTGYPAGYAADRSDRLDFPSVVQPFGLSKRLHPAFFILK